MPAKKRASAPKAVKKTAKKSQTAKKKKPAPKKKAVKKKIGTNKKPKRPVEGTSRKRRASESGQSIRKPTKKKKVEKKVTSSAKNSKAVETGKISSARSKSVENQENSATPKKKRRTKKAVSSSKKRRKKVEDLDMAAVEIIKPALRKIGIAPRKVLSGDIKILSYNVNGIRAATKKGLIDFLRKEDADIVCFSETKCDEENNPISELEGYTTYWYDCTFKKGYAGTCILSKSEALSVQKGHGVWDNQGRVITLEYPSFYLCHCYVPNSGEGTHLPHKGRKLKFEDRRKAWDVQMMKHLKSLTSKKPTIWTGDLNVAIQDFDVFDGETNKKRSQGAGFTPYERTNFGEMVRDLQLHDVYREFYPEERSTHYTFWSFRSRARPVNKGWRLDYFVVTKDVLDAVKTIEIRKQFEGTELALSDHVPLIMCFDPNSL